MKWIIDLLLEKLRKKEQDFEPAPLYIEDEYPENYNREEEEEEDNKSKVIIIDL